CWEEVRVARGTESPAYGDGEKRCDGDGEEPPQVGSVVGCDEAEGDGDCGPSGVAPVVPDDEVVPELAERPKTRHAGAPVSSRRLRRRRSIETSRALVPSWQARSPTREASLPGQCSPARSPAQEIPNVVSMTRTANLIASSG